MGRLQDRVALVFGASPHIAGTTAHWFAKEGARVAVADYKAEAAEACANFLRGKGFDAHALVGDPTQEADAQRLVAEAVSHYGHVDIMFNQVGNQYRHTVLDMNLHDWNRSLHGYLTGGMLTTKYTARAMTELGIAGSIIHIVSDAGHQGEAGNTAYNAAKAGLLNFCRGAAMELARSKIRVNTISPTFMDHLLWQYPAKMLNPRLHGPNTMSADDFLKGIPLGRFCNARDIANAAVFLASDESSFMTGQDLMLDGGARAGYFCWEPGQYSGISTEDAIRELQPHQYGEPAPQIKIDY
jgi:NAD(P)-dependent dehydrogenase (short-subunit alcohol dehydrogenase family)